MCLLNIVKQRTRLLMVGALSLISACATVPLAPSTVLSAPPDVTVQKSAVATCAAGWLSFQFRCADGIAVGSHVLLHPRAERDTMLLKHEFRHVLQWRRYRAFPVQYLAATIRCMCRMNRFEKEAYR